MAAWDYYTITSKPFFLENVTANPIGPIVYSAADFRRYHLALNRRTGVLGPSHFMVTQADNVGFSIKVHSGFAQVGTYLVGMGSDTDAIPLSFPTNPPATRVHEVYLVVYDEALGGVGYGAGIVIVQDQGAGITLPPEVTASIKLATVTYKPGQPNVQNKDINNIIRHGSNADENFYFKEEGRLKSGFVPADDETTAAAPRAVYEGGVVRLTGSIRRQPTAVFAGDNEYVIATMWSNLAPHSARSLIGATNRTSTSDTGLYFYKLQIDADGTMTAFIPKGTSPKYLYLDGMSYELDY